MSEAWNAESYQKMAAHIRGSGFSAYLRGGERGQCGCFIRAYFATHPGCKYQSIDNMRALLDVTGVANFEEHTLMRAGWDESATLDAAAACEIAADLVTP